MLSTQEIGSASRQATILIVEDHGYVRHTLREWLGEVFPGSNFLEARTGEEAVTLACAEPPAVVLMDIDLPGMNGIEATRRIKAAVPAVQVIMLSIHEDPVYRTDAAAAGASAYVSKGTMAAELIPAILALLPGGRVKG